MKKIILNFDLNRTVLMSDAAGGRGMVDTLNYLLSEVCWGTINPIHQRWEPSAQSIASPSSQSPLPNDTNVINYKKYVDSKYNYLVEGRDTIPEGFDNVSAYNKVQKKFRKNLHGTFTNKDQPGHLLVEHLNGLVDRMHMPKEASAVAQQTSTNGLLHETWQIGLHFLLPSYINLLYHLSNNDKLKAHVSICYRTFGNDLYDVGKELAFLCDGQHPLHLNQALDQRYSLREPFSTFYRRGPDSSDCFLTHGTLQRPNNITASNDQVRAFYQNLGGPETGGEKKKNNGNGNGNREYTTTIGFANILNEVRNLINATPKQSIGIRDHWDYWSAHGESDDSGKALLIDGSDEDVHVFIDDHVEDDHAHIVDVRHVNDGRCVAFEAAIDKYMVRAHPYDAIMDPNYFIGVVNGIVEREWGESETGGGAKEEDSPAKKTKY